MVRTIVATDEEHEDLMSPAGMMAVQLLSLIGKVVYGAPPEKETCFLYRDPEPGDLVICKTSTISMPHRYALGFAVGEYDKHNAALTVREIGSERTCRIENESFYVVHLPFGNRLLSRLEELRERNSTEGTEVER